MIIIGALSGFAVVSGAMIAHNRFGWPIGALLTLLKESTTLILAGASLGVAYLAYQQSLDNGDMQNVIGQMANVSSALKEQVTATSNEVGVLENTLVEQRAQTRSLSTQAAQSSEQSRLIASRLKLDQTGFLDVTVGELKNYEAGKKPRATITIKNGSTLTAVRATVFWVNELVSTGAPQETWQQYRTKASRVVLDIPPGGSRPYPVLSGEVGTNEISGLSNGDLMIRLSAVIEFADARRRQRRAYLCQAWVGSPEDLTAIYCPTPPAS